MNEAKLEIRRMVREDAKELLELHGRFSQQYVGPLERNIEHYRRAVRRKDWLSWVATDQKGGIVGYITAVYVKKRRYGRIFEIVADPNMDFGFVAGKLAEKVYNVMIEGNAATIVAPIMVNPDYEKVFPGTGFFKIEMQEVIMVAVNNVPRFLDEIGPVMTARLKRLAGWSGTLELKCGEHSAFYNKDGDSVQRFDWTNKDADCRILVDQYTLTALLLGVTAHEDAYAEGKIQVEPALSKGKAKEVLGTLFPRHQFVAFNFW